MRIDLLPATFEHLEASLLPPPALARLLNAAVVDGWEGFPEALPIIKDGLAAEQAPSAWGSRLFLLKDPRSLLGFGGFKGAPSSTGEVELGYAIAPAFQGQGLATEAVNIMAAEAFADPAVEVVVAHTLGQPNASCRVLEKSGFAKVAELHDPDEGPIWRWELQPQNRKAEHAHEA